MSLEPTESRRSRLGLLSGLRDQALPRLEARLEPKLEPYPPEGLRERKKRMTRQLISDTATGMFLAAGFDEVRVADVAAADYPAPGHSKWRG